MKGHIYVLKSNNTPLVYIGSTTQTLKHRLLNHKGDYKGYLKKERHYKSSYEIVKYDNCYIELLETIDFKDRKELNRKEGEYILNNKNCCNCLIAGRTPQEYEKTEKRKNYLKKYHKEYNEKRKWKRRFNKVIEDILNNS